MRLFIAINFNPDTKSRLLGLVEELRDKSERGSFSRLENLHLTWVFLGECDATQAAAAKRVLATVQFTPFALTIGSIGKFRRDDGDIWWAGAEVSHPLMQIQQELTDKLIAAGFDIERRKYTPHITLGRRVLSVEKPRHIVPIQESVNAIDLMLSERVAGKLTYTAI
jgi:2'-5' RNA ligase